jgi:hypothetical protein
LIVNIINNPKISQITFYGNYFSVANYTERTLEFSSTKALMQVLYTVRTINCVTQKRKSLLLISKQAKVNENSSLNSLKLKSTNATENVSQNFSNKIQT